MACFFVVWKQFLAQTEDKNLPPNFWPRIYRVPHKHLDGMTPFESWSGHKPDVTHFRIFGSKAWARIPTEKGKAL